MKVKSCLENRTKVWIHRDAETNDLRICGEWQGHKKVFTLPETNKLFECVKNAIQAQFPNLTVNPWTDAKHGTLD